jgi:hypothetical protein
MNGSQALIISISYDEQRKRTRWPGYPLTCEKKRTSREIAQGLVVRVVKGECTGQKKCKSTALSLCSMPFATLYMSWTAYIHCSQVLRLSVAITFVTIEIKPSTDAQELIASECILFVVLRPFQAVAYSLSELRSGYEPRRLFGQLLT